MKIAKKSGVSPLPMRWCRVSYCGVHAAMYTYLPMLRTHDGRGHGSRSVILCSDCAMLSNDSDAGFTKVNSRFAARPAGVKGLLSDFATAGARGGERVTH